MLLTETLKFKTFNFLKDAVTRRKENIRRY